jgi:protein gp37
VADKSTIEWTDATWNPVRGCSRITTGCGGPNHEGGCYAEKIAVRFSGPGQPFHGFAERTKHGGRWTGKLALIEEQLTLPLRWKKPRRIFVNSMSDLFHENLPDEAIDRVFAVMALSPQHTFQVLTKRAERMHRYMTEHVKGPWAGRATRVDDDGTSHPEWDVAFRMRAVLSDLLPKVGADALNRATEHLGKLYGEDGYDGFMPRWPLPNVWLGVSAERQEEFDERADHLRRTPAAVRFISFEPLLGHIEPDLHGIHWAIVGGESGSRARPMHPKWARRIRNVCAERGVAFFFKQWGEWIDADAKGVDMLGSKSSPLHQWPDNRYSVRIGKKAAGRSLDGVTHDGYPEVGNG